MNTKTAKTTLAILSIVALLTAVTASSIATTAFASQEEDGKKGGPGDERNYGDCKGDFNDKVCKKKHTGSD
jgi:hypothetical protein